MMQDVKIKEKTLLLGDKIELDITDMNYLGEGVGRYQQQVCFVAGAAIGERILAEIKGFKKTYIQARMIAIITPSSYRKSPKCPVFEQCGGCQLQHLEYKETLAWKVRQIKQNLLRIGRFELQNIVIEDIKGMADPWHYRGKVQIQIDIEEANQQVIGGFYETNSHKIIENQVCYIQHFLADIIKEKVLTYMNQKGLKAFSELTLKGSLRQIYIRIGFKTKEIMVILVSGEKKMPDLELLYQDLKAEVLKQGYEFKSFYLNYHPKKNKGGIGTKFYKIAGATYIEEEINGIYYKISPKSFFQVNPVQTEYLYQKVIEWAELTGREIVLDLYCGTGSISLALAKKAKAVLGVEVILEAIADAKESAKRNQIENCEFIAAAAEKWLPNYLKAGGRLDLAVLDPPRKGCQLELLESIKHSSLQRLIYVSCDSATLARDLKILNAGGFNIKKMQAVDMFPWTTHVETVVLLSRK